MMQLIEKYANAAASAARAPRYSPSGRAADEKEMALRAEVKKRVADLEAERDELRARLAEMERQEPVAWIEHDHGGDGQKRLHFVRRAACPRDEVINPVWTALYARPIPAFPNGWRLAPVEQTEEMVLASYDTHDTSATGHYRAMVAAAPEHKA